MITPIATRMRGLTVGLSLLAALALGCQAPAPRAAAPVAQAPAGGAGPQQATPAAPAPPPGPPRTLQLGLANKTFTQVPQWAAETQGFFAAEGVNVEATYTNASTTIIAALVSGNMDIATTSPGNAILTRQKGTNLVVVGGFVNRAMYNMIGMKGLRTLDDLRGRKIGVAGTSTGDSLLIREMMTVKGMREIDDYQFVRIGGTPERYNALFSGAIDAVTLLDPFNYAALDAGFPNLANVYEYVPEYVHAATSVNADWARQNEAALVGYLKGIIRGIRWTYDPANREAALKLAIDNTGVERKFAEMALDEHTRVTAWPKDGLVNEKGLEWVIGQAAAVGDLEPPFPTVQDVTDQSYTHKALAQIDQ
jgi:ABC-type nitrate/sulfonate/bicarbonate transport system substrate-binding protein